MTVVIKVPELGDGIESGDVLSVLVGEGDQIAVDQGIIELETDKAVAEVPSPQAGRVVRVHVQPGQSVAVGGDLVTLDVAAAAPQETESARPKQDGAVEPAASAESVPAEAEPAAPTTGPAPAVPPQPAAPPAAETPPPSTSGDPAVTSPAGPAIRRLARELGVDLQRVSATGPGGRITREDVMAAVRQVNRAISSGDRPAAAAPPQVAAPGEPDADDWGPVRKDRVTRIRATIARNMLRAKSTAPHVTNFDDADITELEKIRQSSKADYAQSGIKLTTMPFVIKAVAQALRRHPVINASIDVEAGEITYKQYVNIGVAVDTERGLMVPVIRDADDLEIPTIARELAAQAEKARTSKITLEDMRGGTFTISNLGAIGGTYSTPVINVPEVAILLVGRSRLLPAVVGGEIQPRLMMPLSLTYDHRLVDGAAAARFLNDVKAYLQTPGRLLLAP